MDTLTLDCATLTWTAPTKGDYTGVRIRLLTLGEDDYRVIHESLNSRATSYRDCTHTGDGYGDGNSPHYSYLVTYIKSDGAGGIVESKTDYSGFKLYGPAFQDHLHADSRNVRLTLDTDSQRRMAWEAPPSWSLTIWAGLQGANVPVRDPWITGYVVKRREFRTRADGYLYFPENEDWEVLREGGDGNTSTSFTDNEQANGRKFVYRTMTTITLGTSSRYAIFDWLWDSPYRDAVVDLAATDITTDDESAGDGETNNAATGAPAIDGSAQVGEILTASTSGIADSDGLNNVSYDYQWIANNGTADTDLQDATARTYTPRVNDVGKTIKVRVSFTDDGENDETLTSQATEAVLATIPTEPLSLTVARGDENQELDASWQAPSSNGGSAVTGYKVQWKESTDSWDTAAEVSEATETGTTHTLTGLTGGVEYSVRVIATNDVGDGPASAEAKGTPSGGVSDGGVSEQTTETENNAPTGLPTITGIPQVDQTLTADTSAIGDEDGLTNVSYRYQWIADGTDIEGATSSTHTLTASEQGQTIQVRVTFTDDADNEETLTSVATVAVAAAPNRDATGAPTISGTPQWSRR